MTALSSVWAFLNSPLGITLTVALLAWIGGRFVTAKTLAQRFGGTIIQCIKLAETAIPDTVANPGLRRFDQAMKQIMTYIETVENRTLKGSEIDQLGQAISVLHAGLEANGNLGGYAVNVGPGAAVEAEKTPTEGGRPTEYGSTVSLNSIVVWFACMGMLVSMAAGCASDNASTLFAKAASSERIVLAAVITYDQVATATGVTQADKVNVLRTAKVGTDALASLTDSLKASSDAYQLAKAAGNDAAAAEATSKAKVVFSAVNAVATRLLADMQARSAAKPASP